METPELIPATDFCASHQIDLSFISSLQEYGLIQVTIVEDNRFIPSPELVRLEQLVRMHYDLNINFEGLDAILNLLGRVDAMQSEILSLHNRLRLYETGR